MGLKFSFNIDNVKKKTLQEAVRTVQIVTSNVFMDIKSFSPIDTGEYLSGHRNKGVRIVGNRVIGEIENVGEYSERVEKGFRKTPVNWHLQNIGQIFFSKGASVYAKAVAKNKDNFIRRLSGQ